MSIRSASNTAQEEACGSQYVSGVGECLLNGYQGEVEEEGEEVYTEEHGREVGRDESS